MKTITHKNVRDAVNNIIQNHAFYATVLMQQEIIEDNSSKNPTFYVDGKRLAYNSNFADTLSFEEIKGVLIHEVMHLVLLHHSRMGKRDAGIWNEACDYAINRELINNGFSLPKGVLLDSKYDGKNAEEIYRALLIEKIEKEQEKEKQDSQKDNDGESGSGSDSDSDSGNGKENENINPVTFGEVRPAVEENAEEKAKIQSKQAMSISKAAGEMPGNSIIEMVENSYKPVFDWREILNQFVSEIAQKDYSFENPDRRFLQSGIILPDFYSKAPANIVIAIDTSGSVSLEEVKAVVNEARSCLDMMEEEKENSSLTVIYCDANVQNVEVFESGSDIKPNPKGGGGTNFAPVFKHILDNDIKCDGLVYITDGYCWSFGNIIPDYPVLWGLTTGGSFFKPPFGEKFKFDIHQ